MTITFFSNFFNHHQKPLCDEFDKINNVKFKFVSSIPMPETFKNAGYIVPEVDYEIKAYENKENWNSALKLINTSDVIIFGSVDTRLFNTRIKSNKLTFKYSERIFRKTWDWLNPKAIFYLLKFNTLNRNKNFYLLCAGGFVANDFSKLLSFPLKKLKWGYFTKTNSLDFDSSLIKKRNKTLEILFVARLIPLKHPELVIKLAVNLKKKKIPFRLNIVGVGPLMANLEDFVKKNELKEQVVFHGNLSNFEVLNQMKNSDALLFTSNKKEGWGAVANEAMANACPIIISNKIGSAPFLIKHKWNGLVFKSNSITDLEKQVTSLYNDPFLKTEIIKNALITINEVWSPKNAANRLHEFCKIKLNNSYITFEDGPCSEAKKINYNWYR